MSIHLPFPPETLLRRLPFTLRFKTKRETLKLWYLMDNWLQMNNPKGNRGLNNARQILAELEPHIGTRYAVANVISASRSKFSSMRWATTSCASAASRNEYTCTSSSSVRHSFSAFSNRSMAC